MFPSPTGVNYYEYFYVDFNDQDMYEFPSPTGVNYYEFTQEIYEDKDFY